MSTIQFNLKNKNNEQIKNEVLNKMLQVEQKYNMDTNYHELFFNIVQNSNSKNNLKLSIQKNGNYSLKHVGGNQQQSFGFLNSKLNYQQELNTDETSEYIDETNKNTDETNEYIDETNENTDETSEYIDETNNESETNENQDTELSEKEKKIKFEQENNCSYSPGWFSGQKNCKSIEDNMNNETSQQFGGFTSDSDYESDGSILSNETDDIIPFTTAILDDDEEENIMDHYKNMRSTKYLNNLKINELKDILKKNNQKITNNGSYLTKQELIKSIKKLYK